MTSPLPGPFRLLAFDMDGTFLNGEGRFESSVLQFLEEARAQGIHCVAATGRRRFSAVPLLQAAGVLGCCVVQNGAVVADVASGETLHAQYLDPGVAGRLLHYLRAGFVSPLIYRDVEQGAGEFFVERSAPDPSGFLESYLPYAQGHHSVVDSLEDMPRDRAVRITAHHRERAPLEALAASAPVDGGARQFIGLDPVHQVYRLEFLHPAANKWQGLRWVCERLGVTPAEVVAVGDDANDVEMLEGAGHSLAAPGATPSARQAARECLEGVAPDATLRALCRYLGLPEAT